jgi:hypothetical protein
MPPEEFLNVYLPQFSGIVDAYWGRNALKLHSEYLGASLLILAGAAFGYQRRKSFVWFWIGVLIWAALVALGGFTPFYRLWYLLPMMSKVRAPGMIFFIVSLGTAVLAAIGTERLMTEPLRKRYLLGWGIAAVVIALLASVGFFSGLARGIAAPDRIPRIDANAPDVVLGAWRSLLFVAAVVGVLWLHGTRKLAPLATGVFLAVLAAIDLWSIDRLYWRFSPPARELYAPDEAVQYIQRQPGLGRTIAQSLLAVTGQYPSARNALIEGDALMMYGVRTVTGHQGNEIQRWVELSGAHSPGYDLQRLLDPQYRRLTNLRFWLTDMELPPEFADSAGVVRRVGPVQSSVGTPVYLYEFKESNPPAWVAPVVVEAPPQPILQTVLDPRFDPKRAALFDSSADITGVQVTTLPEPSTITPRVTTYAPGHMVIELDEPATTGSALVVSENYYPGWSATVDGRVAPVGRADYTFIGVPLPQGARRVELRFVEDDYELGKTITIVAVLAALALVAGGAVLDLRKRSA